MLKINDF